MSKLLSALLLGSALAAGVSATAADSQRERDPQARDNQTQAQPNSPNRKPDQRDAERAAQGSTNQPAQAGQAAANDPAQHNQTPNQADQAGADEGNMGRNPNQPGGEVTAKEKEYLADIKKCDSLTGDQKKQCVSAAKKKAGQM